MFQKKHINKFLASTQSRDTPANLFMFMCCFFPWFSNLWNFQRFPGNFPDFPGSSLDFPRSSPEVGPFSGKPGTLSWLAQNFLWKKPCSTEGPCWVFWDPALKVSQIRADLSPLVADFGRLVAISRWLVTTSRRLVAISRHWGCFWPFLMILGIVPFPRALSRQGKMQEFFDKFKAGLRTHKPWA